MDLTSVRDTAFAIAAAIAAAGSIAANVPAPVSAQEPVSFAHPEADRFPANTVVVRYAIDPSALQGVTTSADLVAALREHLGVEASMPLEEPLWVTLQGAVQSPEADLPYGFGFSDIGFALEGGGVAVSDLASVIRASHEADTFSDWEEEAVWGVLLEAIETGLADPASPLGWANALRPRNDEGHVELGIAAVHQLCLEDQEFWEVSESLERDYIELRPDVSFQSASMAGWEPPEGLAYQTVGLLIELEPAPEVSPPPAAELPAEVLERYAGRYEIRPGTFLELRREGGELVGAVRGEGGDDREIRLVASSETEFGSEVNGNRVTFTFEVADDGMVKSVTSVQSGFSMTLPRVP